MELRFVGYLGCYLNHYVDWYSVYVKVKVVDYGPVSLTVQRTSHFLPWYRNSLIYGFIFLGRMQRNIECSWCHATIFPFIVPPGTHYCWVDRGTLWDARFLPNYTFTRATSSSRGCYQAAPPPQHLHQWCHLWASAELHTDHSGIDPQTSDALPDVVRHANHCATSRARNNVRISCGN